MPSIIAWLDSTPEEQKAARELIAMFSDKESRDELGIGPIRDAFSDLLFPGTSVLQTRARYYLFIPWCYTTKDLHRFTGTASRDKGRNNERTLIKTLKSSGASDKTGLIGARAGVNVRNLPSDIYWSGMLRYGVREHGGSIGSLNVGGTPADEATELTERAPAEWNRTIPAPPPGFPERLDDAFELSQEEARWLKERIVGTTEGTLLAHLIESGSPIAAESPAPWASAPESRFEELHHARLFSATMQGAALLYNLLIAERYEAAGLKEADGQASVSEYRERLADWHADLTSESGAGLAEWDLRRTWELTKRSNPNIQPQAQRFVTYWVNGLRASDGPADDASLRQLVEQREKRKGSQSRLKNEKMLAAWSGASGTGRLTYRWGTVKVLINDIIEGLDRAGA